MSEIIVSIRCITYNHVKYIRQALNSFLNQRTSFEYEIVVHDDASTDGTIEILQEYQLKYPEKIRVFFEENNLYSQGKLTERMSQIDKYELKGKYVAYCEGDDLWIDNNKLQLQVDYMESNPECIMTGHNVLVIDSRGDDYYTIDGFKTEQDVTTEEIIINDRGGFQTSSFIVRKDCLPLHIELMGDSVVGDWPLKLASSIQGTIHYFDRVMSVYRYCNPGAWTDEVRHDLSSHLRYRLTMSRYFQRFDQYTNFKYHSLIDAQISAFIDSVISENEKTDFETFNQICKVAIQENSANEELIRKICDLRENVDIEEKRMLQFVSNYSKLFIMGTGEYSEKLVRKLNDLHIKFDGFVLSNDQPMKSSLYGKKVFYLKEVAELDEEIGILVGIKKNMKDIIEKSIESNGIKNYFWPLL